MARRLGVASGAVLALALAYLVGGDGSPGWQAARVLLVVGVTAVGAVIAARTGPAGRGSVGFAAGALGVTVGLAIGLPHMAKSGLTVVSLAGSAALVAGAMLLAMGAWHILRGRRWWVKIPLAAAMLLVVAGSLLTLGQALAATNVAPTALATDTPAQYGLEYREATLRASDGVALSGWYVPSVKGSAVVLRHGAGSTRTDVLPQAAALADMGFGVLMPDARGHGNSQGRAMDFGWYGDLDIRAAVDYLAGEPGVVDDRIAVVGLSMGGEEAIGAAAADPRISAVVAEGAGQRVAADKAWLSDVYGWRGALQEHVERITFATADVLTDAAPPIPLREAAAAAAPRPMLLIAGGATADEARAAGAIRSGSPGSVTVWIVPGAGHIGGLATQPEQWAQRVGGFLARSLAGAEAS
ncbi:MAG: alpha/beta fold hydrolase [Candidatus Nanopelagicales bacterium]